MDQKIEIERVRHWVRSAERIAVLTGAGISAESGIPTFRGDQGLWKNFRAEELANPEAFRQHPERMWEWYDWRRSLIGNSVPNAGHFALVEIERSARHFTLITQNVDGLHDLAGSRSLLKLHGDIWQVRCTRCGYQGRNLQIPLQPLPPLCKCGARLRPDIVWFGEMLPQQTLETAWRRSQDADLLLVIGTSALVQPAASLPLAAKQGGARLVEVNLQETGLSRFVDISLLGHAAEILPLLAAGDDRI